MLRSSLAGWGIADIVCLSNINEIQGEIHKLIYKEGRFLLVCFFNEYKFWLKVDFEKQNPA